MPVSLASRLLRRVLVLLVLIVGPGSLVGPAGVVADASVKRVAVISSRDVDASRQALRGFTETVGHSIVAEYDLRGDPARAGAILSEIATKTMPDLLFVVGTLALQAVAGKVRDLPVVYAMVLNPPAVLPPAVGNVTGASMNVPPDRTMQVLKELGPGVRRVGVIYNPANTGYLIREAAAAAGQQGLELVSRGVRSTREAIRALDSLKGKVDILWMVPDRTVLADGFVTAAFLFSYRNNVPVVGLSETHTDRGAVISVGFGSSEDIGKQAGEIANAILRGKKPAEVPYTMARQLKITVNPKGAGKLGIELPDSVLATASNVVQAPVYEEGDWWVFRVKWNKGLVKEYRVTYRSGKFESGHPDFLNVSEHPGSISWLPLISVNMDGPKKRWFDFPLVAGKKWSFRYRHRRDMRAQHLVYQTSRSERSVTAQVMDLGSEPVFTPAGKFSAVKIRRIVEQAPTGQFQFTYFYSSQTKSTVKVVAEGLSEGIDMDRLDYGYEMELVAYGRGSPKISPSVASTASPSSGLRRASPKVDWSRVDAPVYEEGDWWVFRVKQGDESEEHRVTYRNGGFESDDPFFLEGGSDLFSLTWLPLVSVHLSHPERKWFDFPLVREKQWKFSYSAGRLQIMGGVVFENAYEMKRLEIEAKGRRESVARVGDTLPETIETPAGKFETVLIERRDTWVADAELGYSYSPGSSFQIVEDWNTWVTDVEFKYFYSPETRSVVKLSARFLESDDSLGLGPYELELVEYGHRALPATPPIAGTPRSGALGYSGDWNSVAAPIYEEGEWWIFKVKQGDRWEDFRVTYRGGKFEGNRRFLGVSKRDRLPGHFPVYASVHLSDPYLNWLDFPLEPGKRWDLLYDGGGPKGRRQRSSTASGRLAASRPQMREGRAEVIGPTKSLVETPAGQFRTIRIRRRDSWTEAEADVEYFYSPETRSVVKFTFKMIADWWDEPDYEMVLIAHGYEEDSWRSWTSLPPGRANSAEDKRASRAIDWSRVEAPVYEEGDWWVYRITVDGAAPWDYRITYQNGRFDTNHPGFLKDQPHTQLVHGSGERKDLSFPLVAGKEASFQMITRNIRTGMWRNGQANVKVIGPAVKPMTTAAGSFKVVEINKQFESYGRTEVKYFYSPETKSVVHLSGAYYALHDPEIIRSQAELIEYGNNARDAIASVAEAAMPPPRSHQRDWNRVETPVYEDGDWWAFRVKTGHEAQDYKFVRKNGVFESDIAFFTGKPSMVLSAGYGPTRDLHFPLEAGKKWNSRYRGPLTEFVFVKNLSWRSRLIGTTGEVVGVRPDPIETPAGKFKVVEVRIRLRSDGRSGNGKETAPDQQELEFTGFYSPETRCMVKLIGKLTGPRGPIGDTMEIELVDYGKKG